MLIAINTSNDIQKGNISGSVVAVSAVVLLVVGAAVVRLLALLAVHVAEVPRQDEVHVGLSEPKIENNASGTLLTIYRNVGGGGTVNGTVNDTVNGTVNEFVLSQRHRDICNLIKSSADITIIQMSEAINISLRTLKRDLAELQKHGIIQRIGSDKTGHWVVLIHDL